MDAHRCHYYARFFTEQKQMWFNASMDWLPVAGLSPHNGCDFLATLQNVGAQVFWAAHHTQITTAIAALLVGIVVGITGMGGGALMTPALIFLGVGHVSAIVTADLTAAAIYKSGGAAVHWH